MIYIVYILLAIVQLVISLVSYPLAPLIALFSDANGNLPYWLSAFQTYDNTLDGDDGYKQEHRFFPDNANALQVWANRTGWLWRNPAYGFDMLLGVDVRIGDVLIVEGDRATGDNPYHSGYCSWKLYRNNELVGFQYYWVGNFTNTKCLRVNVGWKLWNAEEFTDALPNSLGRFLVVRNGKCQLVFTPSINNKGK
jgi:hypothetical protein